MNLSKSSLNQPHVILCDDDALFSALLASELKTVFRVTECRSPLNVAELLKNESADLLLLDIHFQGLPQNGIDFIIPFKESSENTSILMLSGESDLNHIRNAFLRGAQDFIPKTLPPKEIALLLEKALAHRRVKLISDQRGSEVEKSLSRFQLIGVSPAITRLKRTLENFKNSQGNVLITGETGTGKEVVAHLLRKTKPTIEPFVAVDSATIQGTMAESLLFGHRKGAFTGADQSRKGLFEEANGGVLYFDELGNMPMEIQAKLLRALEEKEILPLGASRPISVEIRIIAATNEDLDSRVNAGSFRRDLLERLRVLPVEIPPLRERVGDVALLIDHFLKLEDKSLRFQAIPLAVRARLEGYQWPGNVRELRNIVTFLVAVTGRNLESLCVDHLPKRLQIQSGASTNPLENPEDPTFLSYNEAMKKFEHHYLSQALAKNSGNVSATAESIGVDRSNLHKKLKVLGIT